MQWQGRKPRTRRSRTARVLGGFWSSAAWLACWWVVSGEAASRREATVMIRVGDGLSRPAAPSCTTGHRVRGAATPFPFRLPVSPTLHSEAGSVGRPARLRRDQCQSSEPPGKFPSGPQALAMSADTCCLSRTRSERSGSTPLACRLSRSRASQARGYCLASGRSPRPCP